MQSPPVAVRAKFHLLSTKSPFAACECTYCNLGFLLLQRWRRRWFVLQRVVPPAEGRLLLAYYADERGARDRPRKHRGVIRLKDVEGVDCGLALPDSFRVRGHMFRISVPGRDYFLAADSEAQMTKWVELVCGVCGLRQTNVEEATNQREDEDAGFRQSEQQRAEWRPRQPSFPQPPPATSGEEEASGPYILMSECFSGAGGRKKSSSVGDDSVFLPSSSSRSSSSSGAPPSRPPKPPHLVAAAAGPPSPSYNDTNEPTRQQQQHPPLPRPPSASPFTGEDSILLPPSVPREMKPNRHSASKSGTMVADKVLHRLHRPAHYVQQQQRFATLSSPSRRGNLPASSQSDLYGESSEEDGANQHPQHLGVAHQRSKSAAGLLQPLENEGDDEQVRGNKVQPL